MNSLDQRNKELSYCLRLCHLNALNADGAPAANFGFELSENVRYDYPLISYVEAKSPGERAGLSTNDILLKINDRKTKGMEFEKAKKAIEKAKRDGRLEMLVVDRGTFDYCTRTKKQLKEPDLKLKHIFPKSRSSANILKVPAITATAVLPSHENFETLNDRLSGTNEDEDVQSSSPVDSTAHSDLSSPIRAAKTAAAATAAPPSFPHQAPSPKIESAPLPFQPTGTVSRKNHLSKTSAQKSVDTGKKSTVSNVFNNLLHKIGSTKPTKH